MYPNYQSAFQPYQQLQPMMMPQFTAPQQMAQPKNPIAGRIVSSADEIAANEVPMDGTVALFPVQDGSLIYARQWNNNGTISTVEYAPVQKPADAEEAAETPTLMDIMDQLSDIEDLIKQQKKPAPKRTTEKKETTDDAE